MSFAVKCHRLSGNRLRNDLLCQSAMLNAAYSPRPVIIAILWTFYIADGRKAADGNIGYCDAAIISAVGRFVRKTLRPVNHITPVPPCPEPRHLQSLPPPRPVQLTARWSIGHAANSNPQTKSLKKILIGETSCRRWHPRHSRTIRAVCLFARDVSLSAHNVMVCLSPSAPPTDD